MGSPNIEGMTSQKVNVDNFARAETARMFSALQHQSGGVNQLNHTREPAPLDNQPVIRQNRDTLYSTAIVDLTGGATAHDALVIRLEVARRVVYRDQPERVDRDLPDVEAVASRRKSGLDVEVERLVSTASPPLVTTTARSPSASATATATSRRRSGSWMAGTTRYASTAPGRRFSTDRGRSPL
jgi:hypothetical protein